jgi:hypothetical protein
MQKKKKKWYLVVHQRISLFVALEFEKLAIILHIHKLKIIIVKSPTREIFNGEFNHLINILKLPPLCVGLELFPYY